MGNTLSTHKATRRLNRIIATEPKYKGATQPTEVPSRTQQEAEEACGLLLKTIVQDREKSRLLEELKGHDAQCVTDFLDLILRKESSRLDPGLERRNILVRLCKLAMSSQILPRALSLDGVRYSIDQMRSIGGSFKNIYRGRFHGRNVCVRIFSEIHPASCLKGWTREIILLANMNHSNILPLCGIFYDTALTLLAVTPWCHNGNIMNYLKKCPDAPCIPLMIDITRGLSYLHGIDIVHSDLKSANVLISDTGRAMLAISVISHLSEDFEDELAAGSFRWMAPELFDNTSSLSTKESDIWGLACTFVEVLTGKIPFHQYKTVSRVILALVRDKEIPLRPTLIIHRWEEFVWELMERCWNYDPLLRPRTDEILAFFSQFGLDDYLVDVGPVDSLYPRKPVLDDQDLRLVEAILRQIVEHDTLPPKTPSPAPSQLFLEENSPSSTNIPPQGPATQLEANDAYKFSSLYRASLTKIITDQTPLAISKLLGKLDHEDFQTLVDFLDTVLSETDILRTVEGKHVLNLLCDVSSSASVFPGCYQLEGVQCDDSRCEGEGGSAVVYKGKYNGTIVCVKVLKTAPNAKTLKTYVRELIIWAHLNHPNVLPFYGVYRVFFTGDVSQIRFVSPWMEKGNIQEYSKTISPTSRYPLLFDVIEGLSYLHDRGIIHSDLNGKNVLVSNDERALITDFGISHIASINEAQTRGITVSALGYTTRWVAPEYLETVEESIRPTKACDIWSLGCLLYEVLSRRLPFHWCKNNYKVIYALISGHTLQRPRKGDEDDCDLIEDIAWGWIESCCNRQPGLRPTCGEIRRRMIEMKFQDHRPELTAGEGELSRSFPKVKVDSERLGIILNRIEEELSCISSCADTGAMD